MGYPQEHYPVLARLSAGYPDPKDRLPTRYSPVCRFTHPVAGTFALDLHVLGTPPAFVLSQDQTLQIRTYEVLASKQAPVAGSPALADFIRPQVSSNDILLSKSNHENPTWYPGITLLFNI
jgi:hypothetical protein